MAYLRYLIVFVIAAIIVIGVFMWNGNDTPAISFTQPSDDSAVIREEDDPANSLSAEQSAMVPGIESLSSSTPQLSGRDTAGFVVEDALTEQQLTEQIALAQKELLQMESLTARKQAQMDKIIAQEGNAEQSLIEAELAYRIGGWRQAWRTGDTHRYFDHYSEHFKPSDGKTLEQWKAQRVKRLNRSNPIDLTLENFEVIYDPETKRSLVMFKQFYKSGNYQDTIMKRLVLANEQGQWNIVSETVQ